jgi:hypothetical protein
VVVTICQVVGMMKSFLSVAVRGSKVLTGRHVRSFASSGVRFNSTSTHCATVSVSEGVSDAVKSTVTPAAVFDKAFIHTNGVEEAPVRSDKDRLVVFYDGKSLTFLLSHSLTHIFIQYLILFACMYRWVSIVLT